MKKLTYNIEYPQEGSYIYGVKEAKSNSRYIHISISKEDIGNLLQGKNIKILFLNAGYESPGIIDVQLSDSETNCISSEGIYNYMMQKIKDEGVM